MEMFFADVFWSLRLLVLKILLNLDLINGTLDLLLRLEEPTLPDYPFLLLLPLWESMRLQYGVFEAGIGTNTRVDLGVGPK